MALKDLKKTLKALNMILERLRAQAKGGDLSSPHCEQRLRDGTREPVRGHGVH